jgi:hypothetical protein
LRLNFWHIGLIHLMLPNARIIGNRRAINTPSSEQVRQPLFREGLSQWWHYDPWLDPLKEMLGDAIGRYRD